MAYDHSRKIGNEGDVAKHSVLHSCLESLLAQADGSDVFEYRDSHCGRPSYVLPASGEWTRGVQLVSRLTDAQLRAHALMREYREAFVPYQLQPGQRYWGSSEIVFQTLRRRKAAFQMHLYETDAVAHDDLVRHFYPWADAVHVLRVNGYEGVLDGDGANLVLIDPPSLDSKELVACIASLAEKGTPFICWTPRNSSSDGEREESAKSASFREECGAWHHLPVRWSAPSGAGQQMFGCCITVSNDLRDVAEQTLSSLVALLADKGWERN